MDLPYRARALASTEERVKPVSLRVPAESALSLWVNMTHVLHSGWHLAELFKVFFVGICKNAICAVAFFLLILTVDVHWLVSVADFLDGEFYSTNLQDVPFLNFIILQKAIIRLLGDKREGKTYDFFVIDFQTTNNQVHRLLHLSMLHHVL